MILLNFKLSRYGGSKETIEIAGKLKNKCSFKKYFTPIFIISLDLNGGSLSKTIPPPPFPKKYLSNKVHPIKNKVPFIYYVSTFLGFWEPLPP